MTRPTVIEVRRGTAHGPLLPTAPIVSVKPDGRVRIAFPRTGEVIEPSPFATLAAERIARATDHIGRGTRLPRPLGRADYV